MSGMSFRNRNVHWTSEANITDYDAGSIYSVDENGIPFKHKPVQWISDANIKDCDAMSTCSRTTDENDSVHEMKTRGIFQRIRNLFINQQYTDVTFALGSRRNKQILKAHKAVLASASPKFAEMFFGENKSQQTEAEIQVTIVNFEIFKSIIEFLYTDDVCFYDDQSTLEIYRGAKHYQIQTLMDRCDAYFETLELTSENACTMFHLAATYGIEMLKNRCSLFIQEYTNEIIRSSSFLKSPMTTVRAICKLQKLNLQSEVHLFEAVIRWSTEQEGGTKHVRVTMEPLLKSIRFLAMTMDEFHILEKRYPHILTKDETISIMMSLAKPNREYSGLPSWVNKGSNRCFPISNRSTGDKGFEDSQHETVERRESLPLKPSRMPQVCSENFTCFLEMKCLNGRHEVKAIKFAFQKPVHPKSVINSLNLTMVVRPKGFTHTERLRIQNSCDVLVPFSRKIIVGAGDTLFVSARAEDIQHYHFLEFDENNSFSKDSPFECTIACFPKEKRLYFISEVQFGPFKCRPLVDTRRRYKR